MSGCPSPSSDPSAPRVSVVMANHNGAEFLAQAIRSVLSQTLADLELIVVDDASTDASPQLIATLSAEDRRLVPINLTANAGPGAARNRALDIARGTWIAVVDSDDLIHPRRLERLVGRAEAEDLPLVADDLIFFSSETAAAPRRLFENADFGERKTLTLSALLDDDFAGARNLLGYVKPVMRRNALGSLRYREDLPVGEDFDLLLRLATAGHNLTVLSEAWYLYRRHSGSVSHRMASKNAQAMARALADLRQDIAHREPEAIERLDRRINVMSRMARRVAIEEDLKSHDPLRAAWGVMQTPAAAGPVLRTATAAVRAKYLPRYARETLPSDLLLVAPGTEPPQPPASWRVMRLKDCDRMTAPDRAMLTAAAADPKCTVHVPGDIGADLLGFIADPDRLTRYPALAEGTRPLVHVRTPTYKRPQALKRALEGLQAQTESNWICDVYDDDPECSGKAVVCALDDPRIRYTANAPRRFASRNLDLCFSRFNPHGARYFFVLEDDNQVMPRFIEDNIRICETEGVEIVLRNQLVERQSGTDAAHVSETGLLDRKYREGICPVERLHLSILADFGVSNGGLFWSRNALSDLEIGVPCSATLQEYLRTVAIAEPIYIALEPLAIWAENGDLTGRDDGNKAGWLRRELRLKRSVQDLQRHIWRRSPREVKQCFLDDGALRYPAEMRAAGMIKSLCRLRVGNALPPGDVAHLALRGLLIRLAGRHSRELDLFLDGRKISPRGRASAALP